VTNLAEQRYVLCWLTLSPEPVEGRLVVQAVHDWDTGVIRTYGQLPQRATGMARTYEEAEALLPRTFRGTDPGKYLEAVAVPLPVAREHYLAGCRFDIDKAVAQ
jgi:hypothetical protein